MTVHRHLRIFLLLALISVNLLVISLTGYSINHARDIYVQRAEILAQNVANAVDQSLSGTADKIDLALRSVVDELESQLSGKGLNLAAVNAFMARQEARLPEAERFLASDANGQIYIGNGLSSTTVASNSDRDYFFYHKATKDGGLFITKPVWGRVIPRHIIIFSRRYNFPDGQFAGIVRATVTLDHISRLLATFELGAQSALIVRDEDLGLIVRRPAIADRSIGKVGNVDVSSELRRAYAENPGGGIVHTPKGATGIPRIIAFKKISRAPMMVIAGVSTDAYLADWKDAALKAIALAFGFVVMSSLMSLFLWRMWHHTAQESTRNRIYLQNVSDGIQILDEQGKVIEVNDRFSAMLGYSRAEMLQMSAKQWAACWPDETLQDEGLRRLLNMQSTSTLDTRVLCKNGQMLSVEVSFSNFQVDDERFLHASVRDITERKAASEKIEQLAFYDPLTQLPNRRLMLDRLSQATVSSARHHSHGALMLIDMDNFKALNDTHGHDTGDRFLIEVTARILSCLREGDTAARLGGDEFVVILEDMEGVALAALAAETVAGKILATLRQPYTLELSGPGSTVSRRSHHCTASIGITLFTEQSLSVDELMKRADTAMYQAKAAGRNAIRFFDPKMQAAVTARAGLELDLRRALEDAQFQLHYQPQMNANGQCFGVEALIRWRHPERGMVSPADFISLAEETGLILPMGQWVLEVACEQLARWTDQLRLNRLSISVNVSARQFHQLNFVDQVLQVLARTGAPAQKLKLELTESLLVSNIEDVVAKMNALKAQGVGFSLDDFGTGYSSLSYLKRLPLDQLKIDQSFVRDILDDPNDAAISRTIVALADSLGIQVIAEGVESGAQRDLLATQGCHAYQGYLFSRPLAISALEAFVDQLA